MGRAFTLLLVLFGISSVALRAEQAQPVCLDLARTADLAVQRNLTIKASRQDITTAGKVVNQAKGQNNFYADANLSYYRLNDEITLDSETITANGTTITIPGQTVANENVYFANIYASYPLYNAGRIRYDIRSANYGVAEAQNSAADTELSVVLQTTRTYLAAVYGRENVKVNQESLASYQEHLSQAQKSRKEGVATDYDVIRAEAAVEDQKKRLTQVQNQYELALANLRTALLLPKDAPIDLRGGFFDVSAQQPVDQAEESAVQADPLLRSMSSRSSSLFWDERSIRAEGKPQLDAVGFANIFRRQNGFLTDPQWFVGLQLSQVVFDGGVIRARAEEIGSKRVKNDTQLNSTANDVRLSVRSAYLDMDTASSAITAARKSVDLAKESLRLAERRFAEGVGTSLEVLDANVNLLSAETGLQQSLYQLDSAYLTTHRYLGDLAQVAHSAQSTGQVNFEGRLQ
ncbi:MAG: TolC family protein [Armatimonadota bacterium]|nr:TolC family protein [bacterium]